jgi:hypothetical protein
MQQIVQANECIFVAQVNNKVEKQEGLTQVMINQLREESKLGRYWTCQGIGI